MNIGYARVSTGDQHLELLEQGRVRADIHRFAAHDSVAPRLVYSLFIAYQCNEYRSRSHGTSWFLQPWKNTL